MSYMQEGLFDKLNNYINTDIYPFHMPGHKRNVASKDSPYAYDITEIDGFDNLHHPRGIIRASLDMATSFYGTRRTYYLVNGSTCGILSAISACTKMGGNIIMARNCHKSVYNAVYLRQLHAHYVYPRNIEISNDSNRFNSNTMGNQSSLGGFNSNTMGTQSSSSGFNSNNMKNMGSLGGNQSKNIENLSMSGGIHPNDIEELLREHPETQAVVITSPTYEGVCSHVSAIAKVVHKYGIPLIVDEAHGAHFSMHEYFPASAIENGADIVVQSVHKTLPSLTQTALLHVCGEMIDLEKVERYLAIYQSSSPSYVLMSSIDGCIRGIFSHGTQIFDMYVRRLDAFRMKMRNLTHIKLLDKNILGKGAVYDLDLGKLVIMINSRRYTGHDIYELLLEKYHIQLEMAAADYVIAMTAMSDKDEGFDRLYAALEEIDREIRINEGYGTLPDFYMDEEDDEKADTIINKRAVVCKSVYEALESEHELINFKRSSGRISAEYIYLYPPGIPVVAPGEILDSAVVEYLLKCKREGLDVQGMMDDSLEKIKVIKEDWKEFSYGKNILPDGQKFIGKGYTI